MEFLCKELGCPVNEVHLGALLRIVEPWEVLSVLQYASGFDFCVGVFFAALVGFSC